MFMQEAQQLKHLGSHTYKGICYSLLEYIDYNSLTHCPKVINLVQKRFILVRAFNWCIKCFALSSILAE